MTPTRRAVLTAALAAVLPRRLGATAMQDRRVTGNALWIWGTARADWPRVAGVMAAQGFTTGYLSIPPADRAALAGSAAALDEALAPFAGRGIAVWLAGGDPAWAAAGADGRPLPPAFAELLRMAGGSALAAGVQTDIEPYTLPAWKDADAGRRGIAAALTGRLREARAQLAGSGKRLGAVLHPAFANAPLPAGGTLADGVLAEIDEAVVMAYRNSPEATARFAAKLLTALDAAPKPWRFGVTVQGGPDQATISYAGASIDQLRADMAALDALGRGRGSGGSYGGVAVHAYASLLPKLAG